MRCGGGRGFISALLVVRWLVRSNERSGESVKIVVEPFLADQVGPVDAINRFEPEIFESCAAFKILIIAFAFGVMQGQIGAESRVDFLVPV